MATRTKRVTAPGKLGTVASEMKTMLTGVSGLRFVHRRLPVIGIELVLERRSDEQLRLAIARMDRAPASDELAALAAAFGVPDGCEWGGSLRGRSLFVSEILWRER